MSDLDGIWELRRLTWTAGPQGLHYRAPLAFLVDFLEPDGDGFRGRATAFGRTYGTFELRKQAV